MVARTFTPCMAEAVLSVVNEHFAELGPPLSVRFEFSNHALPPGNYTLWFFPRDRHEVITGPVDLEMQRR